MNDTETEKRNQKPTQFVHKMSIQFLKQIELTYPLISYSADIDKSLYCYKCI